MSLLHSPICSHFFCSIVVKDFHICENWNPLSSLSPRASLRQRNSDAQIQSSLPCLTERSMSLFQVLLVRGSGIVDRLSA